VVLPTDDLDLGPVEFVATTHYHWSNFDGNATQKGKHEIVQGPFQFGLADKLDKTNKECLSDNDFAHSADDCIVNPDNCPDGLSFSIFYMPDYSEAETDTALADPHANFEREYILSNGGDIGSPGFSIYREGGKLGVVVSTGEFNWVVEVFGIIPPRDKWTNIGVRWRPLNYNNLTESETRYKNGEKEEDFGGLSVFLDLKRVGFVLQPEEIGCDSQKCSQTDGEEPLNPAEIMIGCHKTMENQTNRDFSSGSFDEIAIWKYWLNDTLLPYFLGGYKSAFDDMSSEEMVKMLNNVDLADPAQASSAIDVVNGLVGKIEIKPEFANIYDTTTSTTTSNELTSTTTQTTTTTTVSTTTMGPETLSKEAEKIRNLLKVGISLTDTSGLASILSPRDFEIRFKAVNPIGEILSMKGKYHQQYDALYKNHSIDMDAHTVREHAKLYLMDLIKRRQMTGIRKDNPTYYGMKNSTTNYASEIYRLDSLSFQGLGAKDEESYFEFPNWSNVYRWGKIMKTFGIDREPIDKVKIPSILFSGDCSENHVALVASIYDEFPDPGRKNPVSIPINKMRLDSKIIEAEVASVPKFANKLFECKPDIKLLLRRPLRITFELKSGKNKAKKKVTDGSRKLLFHGDEAPNEIKSRYCAIWNPAVGTLGAWDTEGIRMVWSDDTVVECISTKFGTFGVIAEIYEPPHVEDDQNWLLITKMIGYGFSIILLAIFGFSILASKDMWEMFHILAMNFSFALLLADIFMILSEIPYIRENHDLCTLIGWGINLFYAATGTLLLFLTFSVFLATTSGIIGGYIGVYLSLGWGIALLMFGINVFFNLDIMGDDPRCMIGWQDEAKTLFLGTVLGSGIISLILMLVVLCNIHTSALRKKIFVQELSSLSRGLFFLTLIFALAWSWYPLTYFKLQHLELPDFYPAFQIVNSWMGVFTFVGIGLGSKRFRNAIKSISKHH